MSKRKIEELEKQLEESRAREEEARAREEEARAREEEARAREEEARAREEEARAREEEASAREAEERREKEEAKAREAEERREKEETKAREDDERRKNQKTTLAEYLHNCHFDLYRKLRLAQASKSSTGLATSVDGRYYPRWLRPWTAFTDYLRQDQFRKIVGICGQQRLFDRESTTRDIGSRLERYEAGYENAIEHFEKSAVEEPTRDILDSVWTDQRSCQEYQSRSLRFANGPRDFGDLGGDIGAKVKTGRAKQGPDGGGIRTGLDGNESAAFMYDYKAAHKFAVQYLEAALAKETLFMDVHEWTQTDQYSTDSTLKEKEREEARIAMALIQVFNYMLLYGVGYGYVTAGKSLVFLYYDQTEPLVLRWHLCVPGKAVRQTTAAVEVSEVSQTAVAQLASFCLLSLRSPSLTDRWLDLAVDQAGRVLKKWKEEAYNDPVTPPGSDNQGSSPAPPSRGTDRTYAPDGSDGSDGSPAGRYYPFRSKASCNDSAMPERREPDDDEHDAEGRRRQSGVETRPSAQRGGYSGQTKNDEPGSSSSAPTKQYCTQACLLGLKSGRELDSKCPNVAFHQVPGNTRHPISAVQFTDMMGKQLRQDAYQGCDALIGRRKFGSTGVLFKLELVGFGYTFVGKGTIPKCLGHLEHESRIYERLDKLQGEVVPVHLGMVSLTSGYLLPGGARVMHMMMMSWGGEMAAKAMLPDLKLEVQRSTQAILLHGVDHNDEREPNLLWNSERGRVMVIDFDCARLLPPPKHKLLSALSNGRKRKGDDVRDELRNCSRKRSFLESPRASTVTQ